MYEEFDDQFNDIHALVSEIERKLTIRNIQDKTNDLIPSNVKLTKILNNDGYVSLGKLFDENQVKSIKDYLADKLAYDSHVPPGTSGLNKIQDIRHIKASACYPLETILSCPHILELALHRDILGIAENYLECVPTLYSINIFHTFAEPQHNYLGGIKSFHRDAEDIKFLCLFVYLVDVDKDTGPHIYIKHTHNESNFVAYTGNLNLKEQIFPPNMMNGHGNDELFNKHLSDHIDTLTGPAGSGFFADTFGLHRGDILQKDRLILWLRYGLHKNGSAYVQTPNPCSKDLIKYKNINFDKKLDFITRVLLK